MHESEQIERAPAADFLHSVTKCVATSLCFSALACGGSDAAGARPSVPHRGGSSGASSGGSSALPRTGTNLNGIEIDSVSRYRGGARAAYTLIHDDLCDYTTRGIALHAVPELDARGLHAALGAIVERCKQQNSWRQLKGFMASGHEIINHSETHVESATMNFETEIRIPKAELEANLGTPNLFYIFPFDKFTDEAVQYLKDTGYLGARTGMRGLTPPDHSDDFALDFDVYGPNHSIYVEDPIKRMNVLDAYVDDAISAGGWAMRELHGVADNP